MAETPSAGARPRFGIGAVVRHVHFGKGRVLGYEDDTYVMLFRGGETKRVAFAFDGLHPEGSSGDAELDRIRDAVREVLGDHGWVDVELELGKRWIGGTLKMVPGIEGTQAKDIPIEAFFKKIVSVRDKLRVLEQRVTSHPTLSPEEKLDLVGYITRCYGSLTTFNALFAAKDSQFKGQGRRDEDTE
jgi:hypothetical protein